VENGDARRRPEDHKELARLLEEADGLLGEGDFRGANEALKKAGVKAATMWGAVGRPLLPEPARQLDALTWEVQDTILSPSPPVEPLRQNLSRLRSLFEAEARRDSDATPPR
jgi:hypothetical protein